MKKLLLSTSVLCLLTFVKLAAQTTITTWYIIPPTNGCNGVWAVDASDAQCAPAPVTYNMNPMGCVQFTANTVADTTYWTLCAFPCTVAMINANGGACICSTGSITQVGILSQEHIMTTYPNPSTSSSGWNVYLDQPGSAVTVNIYNAFGQLVSTQSSDNAEQVFHVDTSALSAGTYFTETVINGAEPYRQKLILTQ